MVNDHPGRPEEQCNRENVQGYDLEAEKVGPQASCWSENRQTLRGARSNRRGAAVRSNAGVKASEGLSGRLLESVGNGRPREMIFSIPKVPSVTGDEDRTRLTGPHNRP